MPCGRWRNLRCIYERTANCQFSVPHHTGSSLIVKTTADQNRKSTTTQAKRHKLCYQHKSRDTALECPARLRHTLLKTLRRATGQTYTTTQKRLFHVFPRCDPDSARPTHAPLRRSETESGPLKRQRPDSLKSVFPQPEAEVGRRVPLRANNWSSGSSGGNEHIVKSSAALLGRWWVTGWELYAAVVGAVRRGGGSCTPHSGSRWDGGPHEAVDVAPVRFRLRFWSARNGLWVWLLATHYLQLPTKEHSARKQSITCT